MHLHRAIVSIHGSDQPEVVVFFESRSLSAACLHAENALSLLWGVPENRLCLYNCDSEAELIGRAAGPASTADARLLETGAGSDGITYARPGTTLLLVRPLQLARLVAALQRAQTLAEHWRTPAGQRELIRHWAAQRRATA